MEVWPGQAYPLGATYDGAGTNFALFSEIAERVGMSQVHVSRLLRSTMAILQARLDAAEDDEARDDDAERDASVEDDSGTEPNQR